MESGRFSGSGGQDLWITACGTRFKVYALNPKPTVRYRGRSKSNRFYKGFHKYCKVKDGGLKNSNIILVYLVLYIYIYIDVDYKGFGSTIGSEPLEPEPESLQYLLAEWIHFTLFGIIVPTTKLKV